MSATVTRDVSARSGVDTSKPSSHRSAGSQAFRHGRRRTRLRRRRVCLGELDEVVTHRHERARRQSDRNLFDECIGLELRNRDVLPLEGRWVEPWQWREQTSTSDVLALAPGDVPPPLFTVQVAEPGELEVEAKAPAQHSPSLSGVVLRPLAPDMASLPALPNAASSAQASRLLCVCSPANQALPAIGSEQVDV